MPEQVRRPSSLTRIIGARILVFALLAMVVQVAVVLADYYFDNPKLASLMIQGESEALLKGVSLSADGLTYTVPRGMKRYQGSNGDYFVRVRTPEGRVVYSNCDASCALHLLPQEVNPPDLWSRLLRRGKPIAVAGGQSFDLGGAKIFIEVAVLDDQERVMWHVLGRELGDHLAVPMSVMLVFVLGGMLLSVKLALRPVEQAAFQAEQIDPLDASQAIDLAGMPREVANLGAAVNRMLVRINALMQAQRVYTTAIAHEIRTPLAMMKLELGNIEHARARKIEQDLDTLTHFVAQITDLGRLEGADRSTFRSIDLAALSRAVVSDVAPWVYDQKNTIAFEDAGPTMVEGHPSLIENAVRNLIENAIRHTPGQTAIEVTAGPGPRVSVSDDAGLLRQEPEPGMPDDGLPDPSGIGLEIVRRIMQLHRGTLEMSVERGNRTTMELAFATDQDREG
ncbi:sensor histidine kinase [Lichenifustis flavocetrariae]|uniref:histidine kinase n=1 Tax=Lichenifustis flavocetrariae TaxID=2949735 RepID=A0AA41Z4T8_9HYPH|nr:HAMP domain-containing sensor histidine kinase [Lichenifustis flavocetrariae]MCW6512810.1 HAMP domain-containing histidine kinase [Lichenifustis flavocetrariae]